MTPATGHQRYAPVYVDRHTGNKDELEDREQSVLEILTAIAESAPSNSHETEEHTSCQSSRNWVKSVSFTCCQAKNPPEPVEHRRAFDHDQSKIIPG